MPKSIRKKPARILQPSIFDWRHSWQSGAIAGVVVSLSALLIGAGVVGEKHISERKNYLQDVSVVSERMVIATAYSSTPDQTDDTPCHTADQFDLCLNNLENIIANNGLPFGTLVRFPDLYDDRIFVVHDRMNARYGSERIDFWMRTRERAQTFGVKKIRMEILEYAS